MYEHLIRKAAIYESSIVPNRTLLLSARARRTLEEESLDLTDVPFYFDLFEHKRFQTEREFCYGLACTKSILYELTERNFFVIPRNIKDPKVTAEPFVPYIRRIAVDELERRIELLAVIKV
jgi:hypothetical protein